MAMTFDPETPASVQMVSNTNGDGGGWGSIAHRLIANRFEPGALRPWKHPSGGSFITVPRSDGRRDPKTGRKLLTNLTTNAPSTLRYEEWKEFDTIVIDVIKQRVQVYNDLVGAGLIYNIGNGLAKSILFSQNVSDITPARIGMDPLTQSERDRPHYDLVGLPLPVIFKDLSFNIREIEESRNGSTPLDTTSLRLAATRVAEKVDQLILGVNSEGAYGYGGFAVYGLTNFPSRQTHTMTAFASQTGATLVADVLAMRQKAYNKFIFGPFVLYNSPSFDAILDKDYSESKGDWTARQRILEIRGIERMQTVDWLTGNKMILVPLRGDQVQVVNGLEVTTIQWETEGGMAVHFKIMCIKVPRLRTDQNGSSGIIDGTAA